MEIKEGREKGRKNKGKKVGMKTNVKYSCSVKFFSALHSPFFTCNHLQKFCLPDCVFSLKQVSKKA